MKGIFPFKLNDINYNGPFPRFEYFNNLTIEEYLLLKNQWINSIWNFKDEALKYCKLDCLILHQILTQFNELVFKEFTINIHKVLTLPSLAMRIYKTFFMPDNSIYQLHGKIETNIRQSYTGGATDVYIPHNRITSYLNTNNIEYETLYCYDVNALYPTVMANMPIPIGLPTGFSGDITKIDPDAFGFFYCNITSPAILDHPILQQRVKTVDGTRTIAGLGNWSGWIFSEEMFNAMKFGYKFNILRGYLFNKGNLFNEYVNKMYNLRLQYDKSDPMNGIAKLLQNSLYGKFGMKDEFTKIKIFNNVTVDKTIISKFIELHNNNIVDIIELDNHTIIQIKNVNSQFKNFDQHHGTEINIAVASAITAYARIFMSQFKNDPNFKLYYTDTDSIFVNKPLPDHLVGSALGQLKLEYTIKKAVFLAPKVYALISDDDKLIIKAKGLKHDAISDLKLSDIESMLIKDSTREFSQEKWNKSILEGKIIINDILYTLKATSNKRLAIYENNIFTNTKPYHYNDIEIKNDSKIISPF